MPCSLPSCCSDCATTSASCAPPVAPSSLPSMDWWGLVTLLLHGYTIACYTEEQPGHRLRHSSRSPIFTAFCGLARSSYITNCYVLHGHMLYVTLLHVTLRNNWDKQHSSRSPIFAALSGLLRSCCIITCCIATCYTVTCFSATCSRVHVSVVTSYAE